jgi:hypothetical protein
LLKFVQVINSLIFLSSISLAVHQAPPVHDLERPEVIRLYSLNENTYKNLQSFANEYNNWCTAVAISDSQALTAGHCLFPELSDLELEPYYVQITPNGNAHVVKALSFKTDYKREKFDYPYDPNIRYHEGYVKGCQKGPIPLFETRKRDFAIVDFPKGTFTKWWEVDFKNPLKIGDQVEFWGYGVKFNSFVRSPMSPNLKSGALGRGMAIISQINGQRVGFETPVEGQWADSGDSGGPVLRDGKVVGIMATRHEKCETPEGSDYMILNTATRILTEDPKSILHIK